LLQTVRREKSAMQCEIFLQGGTKPAFFACSPVGDSNAAPMIGRGELRSDVNGEQPGAKGLAPGLDSAA